MGNSCTSSNPNKEIMNQLNKAKKERVKRIQLLLYGTGECGKTTIARQMRLVLGEELEEKMKFRGLIAHNVIEGAALTIRAGRFQLGIDFEDNEHADYVFNTYRKTKRDEPSKFNLNDERLVNAITHLYTKDPDFKAVLAKSNEYQIQDGWHYFAECLCVSPKWPKWGGHDWNPSNEDLLHVRVRTTGKIKIDFELRGTLYQLIDVGGQQAERHKFNSLFSQMDAVLYVASLSEYNQVLFENETQNRLVETIQLWRNTVNHNDFEKTWFILFLNKLDLFVDKYYNKRMPIEPKFRTATAPPQPEEEEDEKCSKALAWFEELFLSQAKPSKRLHIRTYKTSALDAQNIKEVMDYCTTILVHNGVGSVNV